MCAARFRPRARLAFFASLALATAGATTSRVVVPSLQDGLARLAIERLGGADAAVSAPRFLDERLAGHLTDAQGSIEAAAPAIVHDGLVSSGSRQARARVYGVDDRFWQLHHLPPAKNLAVLSPALAAALGAIGQMQLSVRVESTPDAPAESVHGLRDGSSRVLEVTTSGGLEAAAAGTVDPLEQGPSSNAIFVPLEALQQDARVPKINAIFLASKPGGERSAEQVLAALKDRMTLEDYGLSVRADEARTALVFESTTGAIDDRLEDRITRTALDMAVTPIPVVTAVISSMRKGERVIPYPFLCGIELQLVAPDVHAEEASHPPIVLNDVAARRLGAGTGDALSIDYPVWVEPGRLETHDATFELAAVVPLTGPAADNTLIPPFPGITGASSMHAWKARFPVDVSLIGSADEDYWSRHRDTPMAFIASQVARVLLQNRAGTTTSVRLTPPQGMSLQAAREQFTTRLLQSLSPDVANISVRQLRAEAQAAASTNGLAGRALRVALPITIVGLLLAAAFWSGMFAFAPSGQVETVVCTGLGVGFGLALAWISGGAILRALENIWPGTGLSPQLSRGFLAVALVAGIVAYSLLKATTALLTRRVVQASLAVLIIILLAASVYQWRSTGPALASDRLKDGTGAFALVAETALPFVNDPSSSPGVEQLGLDGVSGVRVWPLRVRDGADVSAVNPFKPQHPRIAAVDRAAIPEGRFSFVGSLDRTDEERDNPWMLLEREQRDPDDPSAAAGSPIVPVIAGTTATSSLFGGKLGTDYLITAEEGPVRLRLVATLAGSILDDALIMSSAQFLDLFPNEQGYRRLLVEVPGASADDVRSRLASHLASFGGTVESARNRLDAEAAVLRRLGNISLVLLVTALLLAVAGLAAYTLPTTWIRPSGPA